MRTADARLTLAWVRTDEEGFVGGGPADADQGSGVSELRIDILYRSPGADAQLFLLPLEVYQLAEQLLACYWGEYYQRTLVVRGARVVAS